MIQGLRRLTAPLAVAVAAIVGCGEFGVDPNAIAAIDFTGIPFPAVVAGDTMRDATGAATRLRATVFDGSGDEMTDYPVTFGTLDTGIVIDAQGFLRATARSGSARVFAVAGPLQSQTKLITIARAPDTVVAGATTVNFTYRIPDANSNVSAPLTFTLRTADTTGGLTPNVAGWLVRWRVVYAGDTLALTDTSKVALWAPSGNRHTRADTTKTDGTSTRRLRVYSNVLPVRPDSFIVIAEVRYRGAQVKGSPVRYVVNVSPPTL